MAKEQETVGTDQQEGEGPNVEDRLGKLEKALTDAQKAAEDERKRAAGLDKKVTELLGERKSFQEANLSKDKLLEIREQELKDAQVASESKYATERIELERIRLELDRRDVVSKIDNFPSKFISWVPGNTRDEIEANAREFMKQWVRDKNITENARKVTGRPMSGNGKQVTVTADDVLAMTSEQQAEWAKTASKQEYDAIFSEIATTPPKR